MRRKMRPPYGLWWQFWRPVEWGAESGKRDGTKLGILVVLLVWALFMFGFTAKGEEFNYSAPTWADRQTGEASLDWCVVLPAPSDAEAQIEAALAEWAKYIQVEFRRGACYADRTLTFSWLPADHGDGTVFSGYGIAHAFYPAGLSPEPEAGDVHFLRDHDWTPAELYLIALHEIGHALGLSHGRDPWGVMYGYTNGSLWLQQSDIDAIRRHYARRCYGVECAWGLNR